MRKRLVFVLVLMLVVSLSSISSARLSPITVDSTTRTVTQGTEATFTITVTDDGGQPAAGVTTLSIVDNETIRVRSTFSLSSVDLGSGGSGTSTLTITTTGLAVGPHTFRVHANPANGPKQDSDLITLTVTAATQAPAITTHPANQTISFGQNATFTAAASGDPTPTVQWQVSTNSVPTWSDISGATGTSLTITTPPVSYSGNQYRAVFTNSAGAAT